MLRLCGLYSVKLTFIPQSPRQGHHTANRTMIPALRPLLRSRSALHSTLFPTVFLAPLQQSRSANLIPRSKRPYLLDQIVVLSDGSSFKQLTTSPRGIIRSTKDIRNNPLWNPSMRELRDVEEDEAGRLKRFRDRFGMGFEEEGGLEALLNPSEGGEGKKGKGEDK